MSGFTVTVPASTANLGPGYDTFGLALGLYDVIDVRVTGTALKTLKVEIIDNGGGDMAGVPTDDSHLVVQALRRTCEHLDVDVPGLHLRCHNAIPHARGLGSSAAAVVAGIAAGYALADRDLDHVHALALAAEFEGHADNAAASLLGGFTLAWHATDGIRAERLEPHPSIRPVVAVPQARSSTGEARALLPDRVPHADAAFTASRAALAVCALTARPDLLLTATEDRLHQDYRESAYPASIALVRELRAHGVAAMLSGAGPSVLALTTQATRAAGTVRGILPAVPGVEGFEVSELPVDTAGVTLDQGRQSTR